MKIDQKYIRIPVTPALPPDVATMVEFGDVVKEQFERHPEIARFMKNLDAYSTQTYNHSVNVALLVYSELKQAAVYTPDEVSEWVGAALVHDAGKLTTPLSILHAEKELDYDDFSRMMRHSIDGLQVAAQYGFSEKCTAAIIGHHVDVNVLADPEHKNVKNSKKTWEFSFGEGYLESVLKENLHLNSEKDIKAMSILSMCDQVEAMRSIERSYKDEIPWSTFEPSQKRSGSLQFCICEDMYSKAKSGTLLEAQAHRVFNEAFRKSVDFFQTSDEPTRIRETLRDYANSCEYILSSDKIKEVVSNPKVALEFAQKAVDRETGQECFVINLGQGQYATLPPDNSKPQENASPRIVDSELVSEIQGAATPSSLRSAMSAQLAALEKNAEDRQRNAALMGSMEEKLADFFKKQAEEREAQKDRADSEHERVG